MKIRALHAGRRTTLLVIVALLPVVGCGGNDAPVEVSGRVTREGQGVPELHITFQPLAEGSSTVAGSASVGTTDTNGNFELQTVDTQTPGAIVGEHAVTIIHASEAFHQSEDDAAAPPVTSFTIPSRFTSGRQRFTVPPEGTSAANFQLNEAAGD